MEVFNGDILDREAFPYVSVICHQANARGVMGGGLARQVKERYPKVYTEYAALCREKRAEELMGVCQLVEAEDGLLVANLFGQKDFGAGLQTDYRALREALASLKESIEDIPGTLAIPYNIGCGLAGGDWNVVEGIIAAVFGETEKVIIVRRD